MVGVANGKIRDPSLKIRARDDEHKNPRPRREKYSKQKRDSETQHKGFRDFEIGRKFAETQDFQKNIRHPSVFMLLVPEPYCSSRSFGIRMCLSQSCLSES